MNKERLTYIDALRGLAISAVIITHAASLTHLTGLGRQFTDMGGMGVQLFFVISAFTIFFTLSKSEGRPHQIRDFFIRRFFRIIPVYWFGVIIYTLVYGLESRGWKPGPELWHYPAHIFLVNVLHPLTSSSVVPGGWSISCEILFYLSVPLLYHYIISRNRLILFLLLSVIVLPATNHALSQVVNPNLFVNLDPEDKKEFWYRWLPNQLGCFAFGIGLFQLTKRSDLRRVLSDKKINLIALSGVLLTLLYFVRSNPLGIYRHLVFAALFMVLALILSVVPWKVIVNQITVFLGTISYSGYLVHFLVLKQVSLYLESHLPALTQKPIVYFSVLTLVGFALTIPLAYLSYKYIEQSAIKWGKQLITSLNSRIALAAQKSVS